MTTRKKTQKSTQQALNTGAQMFGKQPYTTVEDVKGTPNMVEQSMPPPTKAWTPTNWKQWDKEQQENQYQSDFERGRRYDTENKPIDTNLQTPLYQMSQQEQINRASESSKKIFSDMEVGTTVSDLIKKGEKDAAAAAREVQSKTSPYVDDNGFSAFATLRAANEARTPSKLVKDFQNGLQDKMEYLVYSHANEIEEGAKDARMDVPTYIDKYVVPQYLSQIETSLRDEVRKGYMPKSDFEYIMSGVKDWVPGMLVRIATQTGEQYALEDEAKQQYGDKASWGVKALNEGMAFVDPTFAGAFGAGRVAGKTIQSAVTSGVNRAVQTKIGQKLAPVAVQKAADYATKFGTGAQATMAKLIGQSGSSRVGSFLTTYSKELPAEIIGQSLGMNLYGSLSGGVSTYGQTRDIYEAGKVAWEGLTSKEGVASGTAFAIGMPILHNLYGLSGLGWKAGDSLLKKTVMGGAKLAYEGASVLGTAGVMTAGHNLGYFLNGEDMDWTLNTFMEQTTTAAAMKYNPNLLKRLSQWPKMLKNMGSKATNNPLPFRLEKEEVDMILDLTHTETLSDALYTIFPDLGKASGKLRDVDARVTEARKNYLRLMNQLPWDTANKINMLTGSMTIARPRAASYEYNGQKLMEIGEDGSILSVKEVTSREQAEAYIAEKKIAQNNADLVKSWFDAYRNNKDEMDRRVDAFEKEHNLKPGTLYSILLSDPMSRIGTNRELLLEQAAMQMEDLFRPRGKAHVDQSRIDGENVANDADVLGATPNVEAIRALDAEVDREQANFESALARAPWRKEYQSLKGKGMSDADALATLSDKYEEAELAPLADFVNAQAKQEGFLSAVGHSVDSKVSERVNTLTYRMDDKGEKVQHDDVIELVDADGNIVHLVGGVSGKTSVVNGKEYFDGDLMVIVDANGETHAVKTSDYSINRRLAKSDYDAEYREALGVKATQIIDPTEKLNPERIKQESLKKESAKEESAKEPLKTEEQVKEELAEEPVKEEKPAEEEPRDERGDLDFVNDRVTPDRAVEEIYDRNGLTEAEAGDFVAEKKAEAEKLYTEASNEPVTRNTGEGLSEFAQRKAEYNAKVEGLKRNLEKWNQIETAAERRNMTKTGAELTAVDLDARERDIKRQTEERVDELVKKLGDVEKVYDISEVTNPDALAELEAGRTVYGWYDRKKDKVVLYMPNITNPRVATRTIVHEQVIHRGLSKMFKDYDNVLAEVYDKVMTPSEQKEFYGYVNGPKEGKEEDIRKKQLEAADEWIANNHESLRFKQYNVWSNLVSSVRGILRKNGFDVDYTRRDIENLVRDSYRNLEKGGVKEGDLSDVAGDKEREGIMLKYYDKEVNDRFNEELEQQINGTLPRGHIYQMGMPGTVLRACGFPDMPIEMSSTNLAEHARKTHHPFELKDVKDLVRALQEPVAVFAYGNKDKSQNVIAEIQKDGKNFLVGIHFNQSRNGLEVSSIRGIFPKDNAEWLNWVSQGKTLYLDKEKIQALIDQQRKTLADVEYLDLDSVAKLVNDFENPKLSEEENASAEQDLTNVSENGTRFSKSNENQRIFVSNAEKAVEGIKQEKGTPEQWLKMIEKGGGLKAGEDKWMGLSDWLKSKAGADDRKQAQLQIILDNNPANESLSYHTWIRELSDIKTLGEAVKEGEAGTPDFTHDMLEEALRQGKVTVYSSYPIKDGVFVTPSKMEAQNYAGGGEVYSKEVPIDDVAWLDTLQGQYAPVRSKSITKQEVLDFIRENQIQIEEVKYGEANSNPAFASLKEEYDQWLREEGSDYAWKQLTDRYGDDAEIAFWDLGGELAISNEEAAAALLGENVINSTRLDYTTEGLDNKREIALTVPTIESWNERDDIHFGDAGGGRAIAWVRFGETYSYPVIEDVQKVTEFHEPYKNFNQRDVYKPVGSFTSGDYVVHGKDRDGNMIYVAYINNKQLPVAHATLEEARNAMNEYYKEHPRKLKKAQRVLVIDEIQSKRHQEGREKGYESKEQKDADRELKEYINELTEKYGARFYTSMLPEERVRYNELSDIANNVQRGQIPDAPFAKNWHELAMKRMLRLAAEEGYDKVAWTKGAQQADRYNIGESVKNIEVNAVTDAETGEVLENEFDVYTRSNSNGGGFITEATGRMNTEQIHEIFGKDLGGRIIEGGRTQSNTIIEGDDLRIGGEGMKGFYDKMLPSFMNKYGKKWGTKVGEVELPDVEEAGRTMWSVDVTPEMKESVMEGQTMFSKKVSEFNAETGEEARFRKREEPDPKKTQKVYKLMRLGEDGKLYPLYIDNASAVELGQWYNADSPNLGDLKKLPSGIHLIDSEGKATSWEDYKAANNLKGKKPNADVIRQTAENGSRWVSIVDKPTSQKRYEGENRSYYNLGINGSGQVGEFAMRPGWHAGSLPTMRQIGKGKNKDLRDDSFVWVEGEVSADKDYQQEAESNPDKDIPTHIPTDGYYLKATNANKKASQADRVGWYVAGAFKPNRIIGDSEARSIIDKWNAEHPSEPVEYDFPRESGKDFEPEGKSIIDKEVKNVIVNSSESKLPKNRAEAIAAVNEMNKPFINDDQNKEIKVSNKAIRHSSTQDNSHSFVDVRCIGVIDRIIKNAVKIGNIPVAKDEIGKPHQVEVYYCPVNIDGKQHSVRMIVKQYENRGLVLEDFQMYDLAAKQKKSDVLSQGTGNDSLSPLLTSDSAYKVKDLIHNTQENDKKILGIEDKPTLFRVSKEEDKAYMDAVKQGDMDAAREKMLEAAQGAGYDVYGLHGTQGEFTVFDKKRIGSANDEGWLGRGFYFWDKSNREYANQYAGRKGKVMEVFLSMQEPYLIEEREMERLIEASDKHDIETLEAFTQDLKDNGYDSVVDRNGQMLVFDSSQIKSADTVTYNDKGEVIPLSERFNRSNNDIRFSKAMETELDKAFNEKLSTLNDENKDKIVFDMGRPSKILLDAGVSDKPMKLYGNKVIKKQKKHGFDLSELKGLPSAIADPIAVFDNYNKDDNRSILTELRTEQGNFLVALDLGKDGDIDFNIIRSVFGKGEENLFDWLKRGMATYINEKKTLDFLHHSDLLSEALKNQESSSDAAKVNKIGELNKLLGEKLYVRTKNFKDWFGDWEKNPKDAAKTVDENGEPLMLWHETGNDFTVFNPRHEGAGTRDYLTPFGIFLKPSPSPIGVAREGEAKQMALYANIRNPIEFANRKELDDYLRSNCEGYAQAADAIKDIDAEYGKRLDDAERIEDEAMMDIYRNHPEIWNDDAKRMEAYEKHSAESTRILEEWKGAVNRQSEALKEITDKFFRNSGHDGIVLKNDEGSFGRKTKTYIAFHPNQVKSATGNVGTFSRENDDIRFSKKRFYDGMSAEEVHDMMGEHAEWSSGPSNLIRELEKHYKGELVSASSGARHAMREGLMPVPGGKYSGQDGEYHHIEFRGKDGETYVESVPFVPAESAGERAGTLFSKSMQAVDPSSGTMFSVRPLLGDKNLHKGLRELKEGEKSHVERVFTENKNFEFSSMNKVESYSDIAYIFRQLEDEAIENSFAVLVKKGKPTVIHLGTGNYTATMVSNSALNVAVNRVNPDKIYFVHNHPSGNLKASRQDKDVLSNLRKLYGPKVADGIIINARSGRYGIYTPSSLHTGADYDVNHGLSDTSNARPIKVYSFSKQVFSPDYQPDALITSSDDVAKFVSSHRLGDRQKLGLIISNSKGAITGNIFLPYSEITNENARDIANDIAYYTSVVGGTRAFMFGNVPLRDVEYKGLSLYVKGFSDLHLLDYVEIDGGRHKSASDEGIRFRFAKTPEEFDATQKEAVEKKGIVMDGLNEAMLNVVNVPRHDFKGSLKDARAEARKWARNMYHGKVFDLPDDGGRYIISNTAIDKYLDATAITNSDNAGIHLSALKELPQIISQSIDAEVHPDYKKGENGVRSEENGVDNDGLLVHRMYGAINIDGETYRVKTTMHEFKDDNTKNTPHSYEVTKIELIESSSVTPYNNGIDRPLNVSTNSISAAKLLNGVEKAYDKGKKLLTESKTLTPVNQNAAFRKDYKAEKAQTEDRLLKGNLRETLGKGYTGFVRNLWENKDNPLYKDMHAYVNKEMQKNGFDVNKGVESFLVSKIGSNDRAFWENVRDAYAEGMKKAGNDWKPNLVDVQYDLWLSSKKGNMNDPLFKAEAIAMRDKIAKSLPPVEVVDGAYVDTDTRFRKPVLTPAAQAARDEYDRRVRSQVSRSREAFIDAMESLRVFQEVVGGKDVEDLKNVYVRENLESSIAHVEWEKYQERINKPLSQAVDKIITYMGVGGREGMKQITDYMIQKHGLERNRVMFVRDAIRDINDPKKAEQMQTDWDTDQAMLRGLLSSGSISFSEYLDMTDTYIRDNVDADYDPNKNDKSGISTYDSNRKLKGKNVEYDESYIRDLVETFESGIGLNDMQNLWDRVREATGFTLDYSYKSGMITAGARDAMKNMFSFYVPLRGYSAETMEEHYGDYLSGGSGKDLNVIKNAEGRKSEADNPLAYIANMAQGAILSGEKNVTKQHFYRLVEGNDKAPVAISEIWEVKNPQGVWEIATPDLTGARPDEIADIFHTFNEDMRNLQQNGDARIAQYQSSYRFPFEQKAHSEEHIVPVNIGGQRKLIYILADPRVAQALNGKLVNDGAANTFKLGRQALNVMSTFATSYSPEFILSNTSRDTLFANSNIASKENAAYFAKFTKNQAKAAQILTIPNLFSQYYDGTWDKSNYYRRMFAEFMDNGGRTGFIAMSKVEDMKKQLEKELTPNSTSEEVARKVGDFLKVVPGWVEAVNARSENLNRFATYLTSREMGRSEQRSASDAKEVSVNFNRKGAGSATGGVTGAVASYFRNNMMFFNAGMQATELMYRNLSKDKKTAAKTIAFQSLVPMAGSAIWAALMTLGDDDKYSQIPHWDRRNNICIPLKDTYIKIPLPVELRAFWGMGDIIAGAIDKKLQTGDNVMYELASQAASVMPLDVMGQNQEQLTKWWHVVEALSPDYVNPVFQANRKMTWNGRPIERDDDFLPAYEKAFANTPTLLVEMSKYAHAKTREGEHTAQDTDLTGWQISPGIVHHFLGSYLTGIYSLTLKTASAGTDIANGEFNVARTPFVSRVLGSYKTGEGSAVIRAKYYKYKKEYDEVTREYNNMANRTNELAMQELLNSARYKRHLVAKGYMGFISKLQELSNQATDPEAKKEISALIDNAMADIVEATDSIE